MIELNKDRDTVDGNGVKTVFSDFDFYIQKDTDVRVYLIDKTTGVKTLQTITTHYAVSAISTAPLGFTVTFVTAPTSDQQVFVVRDILLTQGLDLAAVTDFDERKLMAALDKLTAICQQLYGMSVRAIQTAEESDITGLLLPATLTPGSLIKINATSDGIELSDTDIDTAIEAATASAAAALASQNSATASASTATTQAGIATTQAGIATTKASEAAAYADTVQVTGLTLDKDNWTLVSGLYEYELADAGITANTIVDDIPDNADIALVRAALILPLTLSSAGSVKLYANNEPTDDIGVTINIKAVS